MRSPTERSLKWLRENGYEPQVVETFNHFNKKRKDLYGGIDILAINKTETLGVQTTSGTNLRARVKKLIAEPKIRLWLQGPGRTIQVHGWRKLKPRGQRAYWSGKAIQIKMRGRRAFLADLDELA